MTELRKVGIAGLGKYLPEKILTNEEIAEMVDTSDEWVVQRTGIRERRIGADDECTSDMGAKAAKAALDDAGIDASEIDLIICCTVSGDQPFPATACTLGANIGATKAGGWDLGAACSGWTFGAQVATQFIATGTYETILVVGVEKLSYFLNYKDRTTCVIFGDGAGASVHTTLERAGQGEYLSCSVGMEGNNEDTLSVPSGGTKLPPSVERMEQDLHLLQMGGQKVYRFAVKTFSELVKTSVAEFGGFDELGLVVPHQVNQRIIESAMDRIGLPMDKVFCNIHKYGNTSAASIPIALTEARDEGKLIKDKLVCIPAFGAGLAWGHMLLRW